MPENQNTVQESVQQIDLDIDSWLGAPGAESIVTPATDSKEPVKPSIFSSKQTDVSFLDKDEADSGSTEQTGTTEGTVSRETVNELFEDLDSDIKGDSVEAEDSKPKGGRPKTEKSGLVEFIKKRVDSGEMFVFDDYDENKQSLDEYLSTLGEKDIDELWTANLENIKQEVASKTPQEFFESLPEELQFAAKYVADGGQDLKGLFSALAQVEQVRSLDPEVDQDQEVIVRNYLQATGFGSEEEIDEELTTWKDLGVLAKKAKQFKPKLDQMEEQVIQHKIAEQEARKQQQEQAAEAYMQNVFEALRPADINGLKLDKKTQAMLYTGLTQPQYPSISGRPTNLLGHLLEKYQFVEPNYPLIAEAMWLLADPDAYRDQLRKQGGNKVVEQTVRQLKTEQSRKNAATQTDMDDEPRTRKIARPQNIFKR